MRTLGIDLATVARKTAVCRIDWPDGAARPTVSLLQVGVVDDDIVAMAADVDVVAIDAPFGWPRPWAAAVGKHRPGSAFDADGPPAMLTRRETDVWIAKHIGINPLAVAANLIGATAIRCARLVQSLSLPVDVGVSGPLPVVSEVYPAAALSRWDMSYQLYKGKPYVEARRRLIAALVSAGLPVRLSAEHSGVVEASDDALDALICSLVARAVGLGLTDDAPESLLEAAAGEGWIRVPKEGITLASLANPAGRQRQRQPGPDDT